MATVQPHRPHHMDTMDNVEHAHEGKQDRKERLARKAERAHKHWEARFRLLKAYFEEHGEWPGRADTCPGDKPGKVVNIGLWAKKQRMAKKGRRGRSLTAEQEQKLESIHFPWKGVGKDKKKKGNRGIMESSSSSSSGGSSSEIESD